MFRIPVDTFNPFPNDDEDLRKAWAWFKSFLSDNEWDRRKNTIENNISTEARNTEPFSEPLTTGTLIVEKKDVIGWYLYLLYTLLFEPHKYEYYQGARVIPMFKRLGQELNLLKNIPGTSKKVKELLRKRPSEADALLFELLVALLWARNGYNVAFLDEIPNKKTPDLIAQKGNRIWQIECKRQSKTADYTYRETAKRPILVSYISKQLLDLNALLDVNFHIELEHLPDTYLKDLLEHKMKLAIPGRIVSIPEVDIDFSLIDISKIRNYLKSHHVKHRSPLFNELIAGKACQNKSFTCGVHAEPYRIGNDDINNLYISDIKNVYGVIWDCDASQALQAKARDIKSQVHSALKQMSFELLSVVHIGMETFDGPKVEMARFQKIDDTIKRIDPHDSKLRWIFCHFFQSYSLPEQFWVLDETVSRITGYEDPVCPLDKLHLIIPDDVEIFDLSHWERPLPSDGNIMHNY